MQEHLKIETACVCPFARRSYVLYLAAVAYQVRTLPPTTQTHAGIRRYRLNFIARESHRRCGL